MKHHLGKRALLVIDVQNEYFDGALPITYPAGHLDRIVKVFDTASDAKIPIAVIQHHQQDSHSPIFRRGSHEWELHPEIAKRSHDILIDKSLPGSFTDTDLHQWLIQNHIDTVTITGYMTHMCCDTTARQAMHRGYRVEFLSDATGTLPVTNSAGAVTAEEMQRAILCAQQMMISEVSTSEEWFKRISG